jgi:murein DD-endopeptidase MepM/ murein hydrolase activator NlpD
MEEDSRGFARWRLRAAARIEDEVVAPNSQLRRLSELTAGQTRRTLRIMLTLTRTNVALTTAAVLSLIGAGSLAWAPYQDGPVERPAVMAQRPLWVPVEGVGVNKIKDSFGAPRSGGRLHKGIDIFARQGTAVRAAAAGTIVGRHLVGKGGIALYQLDRSRKFVYYYAHMNGFAPDLKKGMWVEQGQVIGYVGTTGNAEKTPPHLHFQIQHVVQGTPWWRGPAVNPYRALVAGRVEEPPPAPMVVADTKAKSKQLASVMPGSPEKVRPAAKPVMPKTCADNCKAPR